LAPDNRLEAANKISNLSGRFKDLAAFVLGVDEKPNITRTSQLEVWMSAARARDPLKDWTGLFSHLNLSSIEAGAIAPRSLRWKAIDARMYKDRIVFETQSER